MGVYIVCRKKDKHPYTLFYWGAGLGYIFGTQGFKKIPVNWGVPSDETAKTEAP